MNKVIVKDNVKIENMMYEICGEQDILDSDLAKLYEMETKVLNRQVKNTFYDRYFILCNSIIYQCDASINRVGYQTFSITIVNDNDITKTLINNVNKLIESFN